MGKGTKRLAVIGATIAGVLFFWRRKHRHEDVMSGGFPESPTG